MKRPIRVLGPLSPVLLALFLDDGVQAQGVKRDALAPLSQGLSVAGQDDVRYKRVGDQGAFPGPFASSSNAVPDFRLEALFGAGHGIQIDAMSTGNDLTPITPSSGSAYYVDPPPATNTPFSFVAMQMSFDRASVPSSVPGTVFGDRAAFTGGVGIGSDLFSYWFLGNNGVSSEHVDQAYLVAGYDHLQVNVDSEVQALDSYMAMIVEANGQPHGLLHRRDRWYFSITPASVTRILNSWNGHFENMFDATQSEITPATVFEARWNSQIGEWEQQVRVLCLPSDIGLSPTDDIDALGYFFNTDYIIYSLPYDPNESQIRVGFFGPNFGAAGTSEDLLVSDQGDIPARVGPPPTGDVDAVCVIDPEAGANQWVGTPVSGGPPGINGNRIGLGVERFPDSNLDHFVMLKATNLPSNSGTVTFKVRVNGGAWLTLTSVQTQGASTVEFPFDLRATEPSSSPIPLRFSARYQAGQSNPMVTQIAIPSWRVDIDT